MAARDSNQWEHAALRAGHDMHPTVKWRIAVPVHNPVDNVLTVSVKCFGPVLRLDHAVPGLLKSQGNDATTMIRYCNHGLRKRCLVIIVSC